MDPTTPPAVDLTRPRLRQVAAWIRDELDPVIAREGPEMLRADDVLTLHEVFHSLRASQSITALDLRATGIHRAVIEVAGTATRWPGRLADDCDRIIMTWRKKFGSLEDLRPFMYGRAGRLEGIASATEFSKASLLQRWQRTCPERVAPKRSHTNGNLGFRAGAWWLNPLFAHYAGIIDLDSTEGGVCYDKHGSYAVLMKDMGEIEASSERYITYRCSPDDKGRFRLTSAVPRSRAPIRILRSHSLNSIWGPKAGVRYEGLYRVKGWTIRPVNNRAIGGVEHKIGDIMYEVEFERDDSVSMEEVMRHPTMFELDDYAEYKRLRRVHREGPKRLTTGTHKPDAPARVAPPITPATVPISQLRAPSMAKGLSSPTRSTRYKYSLATIQGSPGPSKSPSIKSVAVPEVESFSGLPKSTLEVPTPASIRTGTFSHFTSPKDKNDSPKSERSLRSNASSIRTHNSNLEEIREVAPWIDLEPILARLGIQNDATHIPLPNASVLDSQMTSKDHKPDNRHSPGAGGSPVGGQTSSSGGTPRKKSKIGLEHNLMLVPTRGKTKHEKKKDLKKSSMDPLVRNKNPLAKMFDGTDEETYFHYEDGRQRRASLLNAKLEDTLPRRLHPSSSNATIQPLSPVPIRPMSPFNPLITHRRDAICLPIGVGYVVTEEDNDLDTSSPFIPDDPFRDDPAFPWSTPPTTRKNSPRALPVSLKDFISKPTIAAPVSVSPALARPVNVSPAFDTLDPASISPATKIPGDVESSMTGGDFERMDSAAGRQLRFTFKDPFKEARENHEDRGEKKGSEGVESLAPDACS